MRLWGSTDGIRIVSTVAMVAVATIAAMFHLNAFYNQSNNIYTSQWGWWETGRVEYRTVSLHKNSLTIANATTNRS